MAAHVTSRAARSAATSELPDAAGHDPRALPLRAPSGTGPWPDRALAATASGSRLRGRPARLQRPLRRAITAWLAANLLAPLPIAPAGAAVIAWLLVLVLPRLGWIAVVLALAGTAAAQQRPGGALRRC